MKARIILLGTLYVIFLAYPTNNVLGGIEVGKKVGISADILYGGKNEEGAPYTRLEGNVVITFNELTLYADVATYYDETKTVVAEGNIRIVHADGTEVTAAGLTYNDDTKIAEMYGNVFCSSERGTFTANELSYNTRTRKGYFKNGGTLIEGQNTLTSDTGFYDRKNELALFEGNVHLYNDDYSMVTDNLKYSNVTKIAKFKGYTHLVSSDGKKSFTTYQGGEYNTKKELAQFTIGTIETDKFSITADTITADQQQEIYKITGNVVITAKEDNIKLTGEYGGYDKKNGIAEIFGNTIMTKQLDEDPLYLYADRFIAIEKKSDTYPEVEDCIELHAFDNVKLYKSDIQATADSMIYKESESKIFVSGRPVFWSYENQLTADEAHIIIKDKALHEVQMSPNSLLVFKDNLNNYNQISGSSLRLLFSDNKISQIKIEGRVEVIYYAVDKRKFIGLNRLKCGEISINLDKENINKIDFPIKAQGGFYPKHLIEEEHTRLKNFIWRENERPTMNDVVYGGFGGNENFAEFKFLKPNDKE